MESSTHSNKETQGRLRAERVSECEEDDEAEFDQEFDGDFDGEEEHKTPVKADKQSKNMQNEADTESNSEGVSNGQHVSNDQLEAFRQQWQDELSQQSPRGDEAGRGDSRASSAGKTNSDNKENAGSKTSTPMADIEDQARAFFIQGMDAEDNGLLTEAIYFYRKALQLVPDIESKLGNLFNRSPRERQDSESSVEAVEPDIEIISGLEKLKLEEEGLCQMDYEQRMTHISCLPVELIIYILHWVVSNDLDLRSLEMFARVCKGFYMCARDERVWKKACHKVWGLNLGSCKKYGGSWRRMMIERPHLLYDGCYISKMTYVRQGEQGMDSFYRPFHLVEYYRYIRFFPDGQVLMLVSPEDPLQSLPKLKNRNSRAPGLLRGGYRLADQKVTCLLKRVQSESAPTIYRYKRQQRQANNQADIETTYVVECDVVANGRRQHAQLTWLSYMIQNKYRRTGEEMHTSLDLTKRDFPNLLFSRVKSYASTATEPLA